MLTELISKMNYAILELALKDAFSDMCFCEGDEFMADLESYVNDIETKTNTQEQNNAFFELAMPYIEKSIMVYCEGQKSIVAPVDKKQILVGKTPVDKHIDPKQLTESEEIAIWEGVGKMIVPAAKGAIGKVKAKIGSPVLGGITIANNTFKKNLKGMKTTGGKSATTTPGNK